VVINTSDHRTVELGDKIDIQQKTTERGGGNRKKRPPRSIGKKKPGGWHKEKKYR